MLFLQPESDLVAMPTTESGDSRWTCPLGEHTINESPREEPLQFLPAISPRNESPAVVGGIGSEKPGPPVAIIALDGSVEDNETVADKDGAADKDSPVVFGSKGTEGGWPSKPSLFPHLLFPMQTSCRSQIISLYTCTNHHCTANRRSILNTSSVCRPLIHSFSLNNCLTCLLCRMAACGGSSLLGMWSIAGKLGHWCYGSVVPFQKTSL